MAELEDSIAGGADISGLPSGAPTRTADQIKADTKRGMHGAGSAQKPRPKPTDESPTTSGSKGEAPTNDPQGESSTGSDIYADLAGKNASGGNPFLSADLTPQFKSDPWLAYHSARSVADHLGAFMSGTGLSEFPGDAVRHVENVWGAAVDPRAISQSVQNIWEQNSAQANIAKFLMTGGASAIPGADQQRLGQSEANAAGTILPMAANPLNALGGEGGLGLKFATWVGPSLLQAMASQDPNEKGSALVWSALTASLLGREHIPPGVTKALGEAFGNWGATTRALGAITAAKERYARRSGAGDGQAVKDIIDHYLQLGGFLGKDSRMARAAPKAKTGEIVASGKARREVAKAAGASSWDEFVQKAQQEGISDKKVIDTFVKNYPKLGFAHDLMRVNPADVALGDPRLSLQEIHQAGDAARTGWAMESMNSFAHLLDHVHSGLWADETNPALAILKNLAGHNRTNGSTDLIYGRWLDSVKTLQKNGKLNGADLSKAIWGDQEAFDKLGSEGQMIARQWRLLGNAVLHESKGTGYSKDFIGNWLPFMFKEKAQQAVKAGTGALTTAKKAHKLEQLVADERGNFTGAERFASAYEANAAQSLRRSNLVNELVSPQVPLRNELTKVAEAKSIRDMAAKDPEAAYKAARDFANGYYGDFETDFFKIAEGWKARGLKAIRTHQALNQMTEMLGHDGNPLVVGATNAHQFPGYKSLPGRQFQGYLIHPDLHPDLQRYVDHSGHGLRDSKALDALRQIEGKTVSYIMYSPLIHAMNLAGRVATGWLMNPIEMTSYLLHGRALSPAQRDVESMRLRAEAIESGFVPASRGKNWFDNLSGRAGDALASVDHELSDTPRNEKDGPWQQYQHFHQAANDFFWNWARDFGVMMYHLEKTAALKHGMAETDARMWAGQRAKTWVGLTNPEDQHPLLHDASRLVLFAPEWWKSWFQLAVPAYRKSGMSEAHTKYAAYQGAKFMLAAVAMQKTTGNLLNYFLTSSTPWSFDGHFQNGNLPGNQDRIEATGAWTDHIPGIGMVARQHDKTGGRRTIENPLSRQMRDTEEVAGLESGHPGNLLNAFQHPEDLRDGVSKVALGRVAPLMEGLAAAWNVDLYRSATSNTLAHVDPNNPSGPSLMSPIYSALMMSPAGSQWAEKTAQAVTDPQRLQEVQGPFGAKMPKSMAQMIGGTSGAVEKLLFSWLTGVNPPYDYAERSRGQAVSDQQYQQYQQAKTTYDQQMTEASAAALSGHMTPGQWLDQYRKFHSVYSTTAKQTFQNAPHYVNGAEGMLNAYEAIYDDPSVKAPDGSVDYDLVAQKQAEFRSQYTQSQLGLMDQLLQQNDTKYPMLGLYHKTLDQYDQWQQRWASQHRVDLSKLHSEVKEYSALYGDKRASELYLAKHPDLRLYETAKKTQWERTPAGLMYGLLYSNQAAMSYMQARHLTPQQVEEEVQASA